MPPLKVVVDTNVLVFGVLNPLGPQKEMGQVFPARACENPPLQPKHLSGKWYPKSLKNTLNCESQANPSGDFCR